MKIFRRQVEPLGFIGSDIYKQAQYHSYYYRVDKAKGWIDVISNAWPQMVLRYHLTPRQMKKWAANKLSIVPPGCCAPCSSGRELVEAHENLTPDKPIQNLVQLAKVLGLEKELRIAKAQRYMTNPKPQRFVH